MKKKSLFLTILMACLVLGIFLTILGVAMGGVFHGISIGTVKEDSKQTDYNIGNISLTDTTDIQKLDFDLSAQTVIIQTGDKFSVSGGALKENRVDNGSWKLKTKLSKYSISILGLKLHIPFFHENKGTLYITIPRNASFEQINLDLSAVDVEIDPIVCDTLNMDLSAGETEFDSIDAKNATISLSAGDIEINNFNIAEKASVSCSTGNIDLGKKETRATNICNNLDIDCSMGNIDFYGKLIGDNKLDCSLGELSMSLKGYESDYNIVSSSSTLGEISSKADNNSNETSDNTVSSPATLKLDCTLGDIDISYH